MDLVIQGCTEMPFEIVVMHLSGNNLAMRKGKSLILQVTIDRQALVA